MSVHKRLLIEGVTARHALISEESIAAKNSVFVGNMKLVKGGGQLQVYHLKSDHVPAAVFDRDSTIASDEASTVVGWYELALRRGWFTSLGAVFPPKYLLDDFEVETPLSTVETDIETLQTTVAALDSVFSTDAERVQSFVEALAVGGDVYSAIQVVQTDVDSNEAAASTDRFDVRSEFAAADAAIKGAVSGDYDTLKKIQEIIIAESGATDVDFVADRARLDLLEATYEDSDVDDAIQVEVSARQAAVTALVDSATSSGDTLGKLETRVVATENTFSDVAIAEAILASKTSLIDSATESGDTLKKAEDRIVLLEATYSDNDVDTEIDTKVAAVVDSAPAVLSTLNALAQALNDDVQFSTTIAGQIGAKRAISDSYSQSEIDGKVDTEKARITQELLDRASGDTALGGRLDVIEAVDYGTQAELDVQAGRITQELLDRASADTALGGRLDVIEAVDYGTQAELDVQAGRITQELLDRASADTALGGRLDVIEAVDYGTQAELNVEKARIDSNVVSISQKANSTDIYTQSAADLKFAELAAPTLSGTVTCSTALKIGSSGPEAYDGHANKLIIRHHNDCGISILAPNDKRSSVVFGSADH
ncbi:MAG TPA: hypothetical protein EYQ00_06015, partial [Dehalococcoidia bacterium]|nr:hypothetical protein [Dehalococcoidia bacterium]